MRKQQPQPCSGGTEGGPSLVVTFCLLVVILGLQQVLSAGRLPALPSIYLDSNDNLTPADLMENLDLICYSKDMNTKPDALMLQGHYVSGSQLLYIDTLFRYVLMSVFPPLTVGSAHKGGNGESRGKVRRGQAGPTAEALPIWDQAKRNPKAGLLWGFPPNERDCLSMKPWRKLEKWYFR